MLRCCKSWVRFNFFAAWLNSFVGALCIVKTLQCYCTGLLKWTRSLCIFNARLKSSWTWPNACNLAHIISSLACIFYSIVSKIDLATSFLTSPEHSAAVTCEIISKWIWYETSLTLFSDWTEVYCFHFLLLFAYWISNVKCALNYRPFLRVLKDRSAS